MSLFFKELFLELRNITTVDLAYKAGNLLEKALWASIGIIGTVWVVYFITLQVCILLCDLYWSRNIDWESILYHFRRHRHVRSAQGAWPRHGLFRCSWRGSSKAQGCQPEH